MSDLSERKREVLFAVVENYISSAEPVGSTFLSKHSRLTLSPASIRQVMAELEELGFVARPHTSSGGIPTTQAYRFYVDRLMQLKPLTTIVEEEIRNRISSGRANVSDLLKETCKIISTCAHQPVLGMSPKLSEIYFKYIQFVHLKNNLVLVVLVTSS